MLSSLKNRWFKNENNKIVAIADALMFPLEEVKDEAFASKMMGEGVAFVLKGDTIVSPCDGKLVMLFHYKHAFGVRMRNGVEILVHIGIDTVNAHGKHFLSLKQEGNNVKAGEAIIKVDLEALKLQGFDMSTMLIITNSKESKIDFIDYGEVIAGQNIRKD